MGKVFIEESTLTDIGDALRRKHGETKLGKIIVEEVVPDVVISKTPNATGFENFNGVYHDGLNEITNYTVINIPNATSINIKIAYQFYVGDYINIANGNYPDYKTWKDNDAENIEGYLFLTGDTLKYNEYDFENTDSITIKNCYFKRESEKKYLGYYAEIIGYDAEGNVIGDETIEVEKEVEVANTYNPLDMPIAIDEIKVGEDLPEEVFSIGGNCKYRFANGGWDWFLDTYKDRITTEDINDANSMFTYSDVAQILFDLNFKNDKYYDYSYLFSSCGKLTEIGKLKNMYPSNMSSMFSDCTNLRYLPEFENLNMDRMYTYTTSSLSAMLASCYSLRSIPEDLLKRLYTPLATGVYYTIFSRLTHLMNLDELKGLNPQTGTMISNMFSSCFSYCSRVKDIIFATKDDGTPYSLNWKTQTMDLTSYIGYSSNITYNIDFNSGITADKEVKDDATYQALKDDPDWFTLKVAYSRYNKISAINTINSLPDTSAYLATAGGTNTIKFKGASGSATDGGAINTMTEEEIAVATAKGWTVTFV